MFLSTPKAQFAAPFKLNALQESIVMAMEPSGRTTLRALVRSLNDGTLSSREELDLAYEVKDQVDLLVLYEMLEKHNKPEGSTYSVSPAIYRMLPHLQKGEKRKFSYSQKRAMVVAISAAAVLTACAQFPGYSRPEAAAVTPAIAKYLADKVPSLDRVEQVYGPNGAVYRYCREDECPRPTPKIAYGTPSMDAQMQEPRAQRAPIRPLLNVNPEAIMAEEVDPEQFLLTPEQLKAKAKADRLAQAAKTLEDAKNLRMLREADRKAEIERKAEEQREKLAQKRAEREQRLAMEASERISNAAVLVASSQVAKQSATEEVKQAAKPHLNDVQAELSRLHADAAARVKQMAAEREASAKQAQAVSQQATGVGNYRVKVALAEGPGSRLKMDISFDSAAGVASFENGSQVLDGLSKAKIAELSPQAKEAERVRLRGHAAAVTMTEELKKLAIGRAYAVKTEFQKNGVDKEKIMILNPRNNDLIDKENVKSPVNRSVEIFMDMPSGKIISDRT